MTSKEIQMQADPKCKRCKGTGVYWYQVGVEDYDSELCDCCVKVVPGTSHNQLANELPMKLPTKQSEEVSLRDLFALNAPKEVPDWFIPKNIRPNPIKLSGHGILSREDEEKLARWKQERKKQALLEWPYYWADQQLKIRANTL